MVEKNFYDYHKSLFVTESEELAIRYVEKYNRIQDAVRKHLLQYCEDMIDRKSNIVKDSWHLKEKYEYLSARHNWAYLEGKSTYKKIELR